MHRRAIIPAVRSGRIIDQPCLVRRAAQHGRVAIYVDDAAIRTSRHSGLLPEMKTLVDLCRFIDEELLREVAAWIGPIPDLDADGCLSVIISHLDDGTRQDEPPLLGCVRGSDFTGDDKSTALADVIYLDVSLLTSADRDAIVVHELTHAAIYGGSTGGDRVPGSKPVPAWLNESLAHVVEQRVCGSASGFAARLEAFASAPSRHPVVAPDTLPSSSRRGGCRAAGALFLASLIRDPKDARQVLDAGDNLQEALEQMTGRAWHDLFRRWSVSCVVEGSVSPLPIRRQEIPERTSIRQFLHGTAFCALHCRSALKNLVVASDEHAGIQVTVIEPAAEPDRDEIRANGTFDLSIAQTFADDR